MLSGALEFRIRFDLKKKRWGGGHKIIVLYLDFGGHYLYICLSKLINLSQGPMAYICNSSYLGG
jgi:hypothetical protein